MTSLFSAAVTRCELSFEHMQFALRPLEALATVFQSMHLPLPYSQVRSAFTCAVAGEGPSDHMAMSLRQGSLHGSFLTVSKAWENVPLFMTSS